MPADLSQAHQQVSRAAVFIAQARQAVLLVAHRVPAEVLIILPRPIIPVEVHFIPAVVADVAISRAKTTLRY